MAPNRGGRDSDRPRAGTLHGLVARRGVSRFRCERGQAITELAVVLPVLLLILIGILDFGRAVNDWNDETHVANLAARYAAVGSLPTSGRCGTSNPAVTDIQSFVSCEVGIDSQQLQTTAGGSPVTTTVCAPTNLQFQSVTVSIAYSYQWIPYLGISTTTSPVSGSSTQEIEAPTGVPRGWVNSSSC